MHLSDILPDDILVFDDIIDLDNGYAINGMLGQSVFIIDCDGEVEELVPIEDLTEEIKLAVIDIIENDKFDISHND